MYDKYIKWRRSQTGPGWKRRATMTEPVTGANAIMEALELYVEVAGDPADEVYKRFFARHEGAEQLFSGYEEAHLMGQMLDRVFWLLMDLAGGSVEPRHAFYWIADHVAWEVSEAMIRGMFEVIVEVLREGVGARWTTEMECAWAGLLAKIIPEVERQVREAAAIGVSLAMK
jgi:hypothetical protein